MRMPVAAQRASIPVAFGAGEGFSAVMKSCLEVSVLRPERILRQVAAHQKRIQLFPVVLPVIAFAASNDAKSGPFIEAPRRRVIFLDFEKYTADAASGEMAEMSQEEVARQAATAMTAVDGDRQDLGFVRAYPRDSEADRPASQSEAVDQRVALGDHRFEFAFAPSLMERCAV